LNEQAFNPKQVKIQNSIGIEYYIGNLDTPERIKLCIVFFCILMKLPLIINPKKLSAQPESEITLTVEISL
jgi:hypothetical protein